MAAGTNVPSPRSWLSPKYGFSLALQSDLLFFIQANFRAKSLEKTEIIESAAMFFEQIEIEEDFFRLRDLSEALSIDYCYKMARTVFNTPKKLKTALIDIYEVLVLLDISIPNISFSPMNLEKIPLLNNAAIFAVFGTQLDAIKDMQAEMGNELAILRDYMKEKALNQTDLDSAVVNELKRFKMALQTDIQDLLTSQWKEIKNECERARENGCPARSIAEEMAECSTSSPLPEKQNRKVNELEFSTIQPLELEKPQKGIQEEMNESERLKKKVDERRKKELEKSKKNKLADALKEAINEGRFLQNEGKPGQAQIRKKTMYGANKMASSLRDERAKTYHPRVHLVLGRVKKTATFEKVIDLMNKLGLQNPKAELLLSKRETMYASYHLTFKKEDDKNYEDYLKAELWPEGLTIRRYFYRSNDLPRNKTQNSQDLPMVGNPGLV